VSLCLPAPQARGAIQLRFLRFLQLGSLQLNLKARENYRRLRTLDSRNHEFLGESKLLKPLLSMNSQLRFVGFLLLMVGLIAGCASVPTSENVARLRIGMSRDQVISVMGSPQTTHYQGNSEYLHYWVDETNPPGPRREYFVRLLNGSVDAFGRPETLAAPAVTVVSPPAVVNQINPAPSSPPPQDVAIQLQQLRNLRDSGALTESEYERAKERVIAGTPR